MVATLEMLKSGVFNVGRQFGDGSVAYFRATASPTVLRGLGLDESRVYNIDTKEVIPDEYVENGMFTILDKDDFNNISELDKYLNGGVAGECFEP